METTTTTTTMQFVALQFVFALLLYLHCSLFCIAIVFCIARRSQESEAFQLELKFLRRCGNRKWFGVE